MESNNVFIWPECSADWTFGHTLSSNCDAFNIERHYALSITIVHFFFYQSHCSREFSTLNLRINTPIYPFQIQKTTRALRNPLFLLPLQLSHSQSWRTTVLIRSEGFKASEASAGVLLRAKHKRSSNNNLHPKTVIATCMLFSGCQQCRW